MAKREKTADELAQEAFIQSAAELDDTDDDLNENSGEARDVDDVDDASANNDEMTDAEISGLEAASRQEPSAIETDEKKAEAEKTSETKAEEDKPEEVKDPEKDETKTEEKPEPETPPADAQEESKEAKTDEKTETPAQPESVTPDQIQEVYKDWRNQTENLLADHHYALKPEELEEFEVEPSKVIPRLMARVYLDSVTAAINQVTNSFPRLVSLSLEQNKKNEESENVFFERWPQLKTQGELVRRIGANYRTQNMGASAEQFINEVGAAAMVALRLDPNGNANGNAKGKADEKAKPFVPATNNPTALPAKQHDQNPFSRLNDEFDEIEDADFG